MSVFKHDGPDGPPVMIVNRAFARAMFGDENPIGKRVRSWRDENVLREIVGVVGDVRYLDPAASPPALVYVPHRQAPWRSMTLAVRTVGEPAGTAAAVRRQPKKLVQFKECLAPIRFGAQMMLR